MLPKTQLHDEDSSRTNQGQAPRMTMLNRDLQVEQEGSGRRSLPDGEASENDVKGRKGLEPRAVVICIGIVLLLLLAALAWYYIWGRL